MQSARASQAVLHTLASQTIHPIIATSDRLSWNSLPGLARRSRTGTPLCSRITLSSSASLFSSSSSFFWGDPLQSLIHCRSRTGCRLPPTCYPCRRAQSSRQHSSRHSTTSSVSSTSRPRNSTRLPSRCSGSTARDSRNSPPTRRGIPLCTYAQPPPSPAFFLFFISSRHDPIRS